MVCLLMRVSVEIWPVKEKCSEALNLGLKVFCAYNQPRRSLGSFWNQLLEASRKEASLTTNST